MTDRPSVGAFTGAFLGVLAAAALVACSGGPGLKPDAPAGVNLAGTWRLNREASDNPQAMLDSLREKLMKRMRPRMYDPRDPMGDLEDGGFGDEPPDSGPGASGSDSGRDPGGHGVARSAGGPGQGPQRGGGRFIPRLSYARALGPQLSSDGLTIEQSPTRLVLVRGGDRRSFTPGGQSVVSVPDGVADQRSGWAGRDYVIDVKPQVGPHVTQRYGLSADGRQLLEKVTLTEEGLPKLEFTRVYDPGALNSRGLPTSN